MKIFLLSVLLVGTLHAKNLTYELNHLSTSQYKILLKTYAKASAFDMQLTMTAIAWQESDFGKWKINLGDPSFGVFHNLISSVMSRHHLDGRWNESRMAEKLLNDYDFSFSETLSELEFWKNYWKNKRVSRVWSHMVMSYNAGFDYSNGKEYIKHIKQRIYVLKKYIKLHQKLFDTIKFKGEL